MADLRLVLSACAGGIVLAWLILAPRPGDSSDVRGAALAGQSERNTPVSELHQLAQMLLPEPGGVVKLEQTIRLKQAHAEEAGLEGELNLWLAPGGQLHMQWRFPKDCDDACLHVGQVSQALVHDSLSGGAQSWMLRIAGMPSEERRKLVEQVASLRAELLAGALELGLERQNVEDATCLTQWLGRTSVCVVPEWSLAMAIEDPKFSLSTTAIERDAAMPQAFSLAAVAPTSLPQGTGDASATGVLSAHMVSRAQLILLGQLTDPEKQVSSPVAH